MNFTIWLNHDFGASDNISPDYIIFEQECKAFLTYSAMGHGFEVVRFIEGHYEFAIMLKSTMTNRLYCASIKNVKKFRNQWAENVLWKEMIDEYDWKFDEHQTVPFKELMDKLRKDDKKKAL